MAAAEARAGRRDRRGRRRGLPEGRRLPREPEGHLRRSDDTWHRHHLGVRRRPPTARPPPARSSCSPRPARSARHRRRRSSAATATPSPPRSARTARPRCTRPAISAGSCPAPAVAAAMKAVIDGGDVPDLILFATSYEGRDVVARLSVKLDRTVLTNNIDIAVDGDTVTRHHADLRRQHARDDHVHRRARRTSPRSGRSRSPPRQAAAAPAEVVERRRCPTSAPPARPTVTAVHVEESTRARSSTRPPSSCPVAVASARPSKYEMIEDAGQAARRARRARRGPSSTPAGCPTATRSARPARS